MVFPLYPFIATLFETSQCFQAQPDGSVEQHNGGVPRQTLPERPPSPRNLSRSCARHPTSNGVRAPPALLLTADVLLNGNDRLNRCVVERNSQVEPTVISKCHFITFQLIRAMSTRAIRICVLCLRACVSLRDGNGLNEMGFPAWHCKSLHFLQRIG